MNSTGGGEVNFETLIPVFGIVLAFLIGYALYENKTGKYTTGLPWPLEPIAAYLNNRARQPWQPTYFNSIIEHAVLPAVYTAVFQTIEGRLHILLTPRSDEYWPNSVHVPGSIVRTTDREGDYEDALGRVQLNELRRLHYQGVPKFAGCGIVKTRRCTENYVVFVVFTDQEPAVGKFYPADNLPKNLIDHERRVIIPKALGKARELMPDDWD